MLNALTKNRKIIYLITEIHSFLLIIKVIYFPVLQVAIPIFSVMCKCDFILFSPETHLNNNCDIKADWNILIR
jgi:hypothetical protein